MKVLDATPFRRPTALDEAYEMFRLERQDCNRCTCTCQPRTSSEAREQRSSRQALVAGAPPARVEQPRGASKLWVFGGCRQGLDR